jgi:hypothetical protein
VPICLTASQFTENTHKFPSAKFADYFPHLAHHRTMSITSRHTPARTRISRSPKLDSEFVWSWNPANSLASAPAGCSLEAENGQAVILYTSKCGFCL